MGFCVQPRDIVAQRRDTPRGGRYFVMGLLLEQIKRNLVTIDGV